MSATAPTRVVTGAGSGIGAVLADRLHARGDRLVLIARDADRGAYLRDRYPGATTVELDLADSAALARWHPPTDVLAGVDSLVHVAGIVHLGPVDRIDPIEWERTLAVNLTAPALLTRALLPAVRAVRGTVVFVNSGAGRTAHGGWGSYAASKFGLRALADALREEEGEHGVRVSTVYPGRVATAMQESVHAQEGAHHYDPRAWIRPETVVDALLQCIDLGPDATLPEIVLRPGPRA